MKDLTRWTRWSAGLAMVAVAAACADAEPENDLDGDVAVEEQMEEEARDQDMRAEPEDVAETPSERPMTRERPERPAPPTATEEPIESEAETEAAVPTIPANTSLTLQVDERVSTRTHEVGDRFTAHVVEDIEGSNGEILIPSGAQATGVVTQVSDGGGGEEALLAFLFETVTVQGQTRPLNASVVDTQLESTEGDTGAETAGKVAIGAAAGALIGQILGKDTESTLKGAGAGAVAGAAVALSTRDGYAVLEEGSTVTVRLNEAMAIR